MSNSQMLSVSCLIMFVRFRPFLVVSTRWYFSVATLAGTTLRTVSSAPAAQLRGIVPWSSYISLGVSIDRNP